MKTMTPKRDSSEAIAKFLASGGKITTCKPKAKPEPKNNINVVQIEIDALPPELLKYIENWETI